MEHLAQGGEASPSGLAAALDERLGNISYHVSILRELDCVELVRTEPSRGALEHFYRGTIGPWRHDEEWARLATALRKLTLERTVSAILADTSAASREGGFDGPETHVSRAELHLDDDARTEIGALLTATVEAVQRIHGESAARQTESGPAAPPTIATELAIVYLVRAAD